MGEKLGNTELFYEDAFVIAAYFLMVLSVGALSSIRSKRDSVSGYFLAGRNMHWILVGASLFASNIGSEHFIGLAGSGASTGIGIAGFELNAIFIILILGWIFVPVYMASGVYTMPEYLQKRFGGQRIRIYLSVLSLLLYVFTKISADLYAGAIFINQSIRLDMYGSVLTLLAVAALFTIAGGLSAVIWTDFAQTILMLLGALVLCIKSFVKVGGYHALIEKFKNVAVNESFVGYDISNNSCSQVPDNYMHLLRSPFDPELPGTGMTLGLTINSVWYWCSDQVIVQRALSAKDLSHAKGGCILAGYLKFLPLFFLVFPGMASRILFPNEIACSNPVRCKEICGSELGCTNIAYPKLVLELMPAGARGLMISVMLAALMSSLTSIFNSSSTIFTMDIWRRIRKQASETELLIVGRVFILLLVAVSIVWIPIVESSQNSQLFHYIQSVISYLAPPICAVYVFALLCTRINEQGAFWGLMAGLVIGMVRFIWEFSYTMPSCAAGLPDPRPAIISRIHYLHFGVILFLITCVVTVVVSLLTQPVDKMQLHRLTYWSRYSKEVRVDFAEKPIQGEETEGNINEGFGECESTSCSSFPKQQYGTSTTATSSKPQKLDIEEKIVDNGGIVDKPFWKKTFFFICGIPEATKSSRNNSPSLEEKASFNAESILEKPLWQRCCSTNALLLLSLASFIWGYYA